MSVASIANMIEGVLDRSEQQEVHVLAPNVREQLATMLADCRALLTDSDQGDLLANRLRLLIESDAKARMETVARTLDEGSSRFAEFTESLRACEAEFERLLAEGVADPELDAILRRNIVIARQGQEACPHLDELARACEAIPRMAALAASLDRYVEVMTRFAELTLEAPTGGLLWKTRARELMEELRSGIRRFKEKQQRAPFWNAIVAALKLVDVVPSVAQILAAALERSVRWKQGDLDTDDSIRALCSIAPDLARARHTARARVTLLESALKHIQKLLASGD